MLRVGIWVESFMFAGIFLLQWQGENFAHRQHLKFCHFKPVHCASKNPISPNGIQPIFEIFASARRCWGWAFGWKVSGTQVFYFCNGKVKLCASTTFEILPLSTCTLCQQKSYISKGIQPIFEIFASARRSWGWAFGRKVSCAQLFYFCNGKVKTLRIDNIWNLCQFQPVHSASKNPISPKIFNRFSKSLPSARRCWGWAFGWKVSGAGILKFLNGKLKTLCIDNIWNFATFNMYNLPPKILYRQRYSNDFRNLCLSSKILRVGIWVESFMCAGILLLQWQGENFAHRQHLKFCHFQPDTLCQQKSYISKGIQPIFEIFASARRCWGWAFVV